MVKNRVNQKIEKKAQQRRTQDTTQHLRWMFLAKIVIGF